MGLTHPVDGGPMYYETKLDQLIQEPWNGTSAFLFLIIVGYWAWKLKGQYRKYLFMSIAVPILAIGGIGGTIYHLFRLHPFFMYMDWLPIMILCLAASGYFINRLTGTTWKGLLAVGLFLASQVGMFYLVDYINPKYADMAVNINYGLMAALILVPSILIWNANRGQGGKYLSLALLMFVCALTFRLLDSSPDLYSRILPMGTHFLWHTFGALACMFIFQFVFVVDGVFFGEGE